MEIWVQWMRDIIKDEDPTGRDPRQHSHEILTGALVTVISIHGNEVEFQLGMFGEKVR